MALSSVEAIKQSKPPVTDELTYLTIIESHLSPEILPDLQEILQDDPLLTQSIGWDLVQQLLPYPKAEACLQTIAQFGNPREVILKVTEALQLLDLNDDATEPRSAGLESTDVATSEKEADDDNATREPSSTDKFCTLLGLLSILHPRIKTKYPSRFLSTTLIAILSAYKPSPEATLAVVSFVHKISGEKRPTVPRRESSSSALLLPKLEDPKPTPDPEAQDEDPNEAAVQKKLLQSFITHILEVYIGSNELEWAARLLENFKPDMVVPWRKSVNQVFKEEKPQQDRDLLVGRLVALARDVGLSGYSFLFDAIDSASSHTDDNDEEDCLPNRPEDIPLSQVGSLYLVTAFIFSSVIFDSSSVKLPPYTIFPDHRRIVSHFIGLDGPETIGAEAPSLLDAVLAIGLWLEHSNKFVSGAPLEDEDFLSHLQALTLISANSPSPTLRYAAHTLAANILHAHPVDRVRLTFISDTLEHCPYENLKASAVGWLKDELHTARERDVDNVFSTTVALAATQPFLFPDTSAWADPAATPDAECWTEVRAAFPFLMAVLNFLYFIQASDVYERSVPPKMFGVVQKVFLVPLRKVHARLETGLEDASSEVAAGLSEEERSQALLEVQLLGERIESSVSRE